MFKPISAKIDYFWHVDEPINLISQDLFAGQMDSPIGSI